MWPGKKSKLDKKEPVKDLHKPEQGDRLWASLRRLKAQVVDLNVEISILRRDYHRLSKQHYQEKKEDIARPEIETRGDHQGEEKVPAGIFGE